MNSQNSFLTRKDYLKELEAPPYLVQKGDRGNGGTFVLQEWLNLNVYHNNDYSYKISMDDDFGFVTERALKFFQLESNIEATGILDPITWLALTAPMRRAFETINFKEDVSFKDRVVAYAQQIVNEHPTELGNNEGPWVRAFMKGQEGRWAAWCNGFVSTVLDHAAASMSLTMDHWIPWSWSTQKSAQYAKSGKYQKIDYISPKELVDQDFEIMEPGDLFLVLNGRGTPHHIGIIEYYEGLVIGSIEGNTNDEGSRDGYELVRRLRDFSSKKYALIKIT